MTRPSKTRPSKSKGIIGAYLRVSKDQKHDSQRAEIEQWLAGQGTDPAAVAWYVDVESGRPHVAGFVIRAYGSGPVRGFATTLIIGLLASMFTSIVVTRAIVEWFVSHGRLHKAVSF